MIDVETLAYHLRRAGVDFGSRFGPRIIMLHIAIVALFGVWWPWMKGIEFLDPVFLLAYACLGILFAAPTAAQAFAGDRPQSMSGAIARIAVAVIYGELMAGLILLAGLMTVYTTRRVPFAPELDSLALAAALGVAGSIALAAVAAWITLRFSGTAARGALRAIFLLLLVLFFFKSRWLPEVAGAGALLCLAVAAAAMFAVKTALKAQ